MKRLYTFAVVLVAFIVSACADEEARISKDFVRPVKVITVQEQTNSDVREFVGKVAAANVSSLSFRIGGEIVELPIKKGQQVKKGQVIALLDKNDAKNALTNAQAQFDLARAEHIRKKTLYDQRVISKSSYDLAYTNLVSATAALKQARDNLSYTVIKAPFDGVIGKVNAENYEVVSPNQVIATIQGESQIEITIQLPESIVANIGSHDQIESYKPNAWFTSKPKKMYSVSYKEHAAEANIGSQTYDVTFVLDRPSELKLLPGMSATVEIDISRITRKNDNEYFTIPHAAISTVDGENLSFVWKFDRASSTVQKFPVQLGRISDDGVEVLSGVIDGDVLIVAGTAHLKDGMVVKPLSKERGI